LKTSAGFALALSAIAIAISAWGLLARARNHELSDIRSLLSGSEILKEDQIVKRPPFLSLDDRRSWTFSIDEKQKTQLLSRCRALTQTFGGRNGIDKPQGCIASYHMDAEKFRYITLSVKSRAAEISAIYLSDSDFKSMSTPISPPTEEPR
jgi:hypothetical protein